MNNHFWMMLLEQVMNLAMNGKMMVELTMMPELKMISLKIRISQKSEVVRAFSTLHWPLMQ